MCNVAFSSRHIKKVKKQVRSFFSFINMCLFLFLPKMKHTNIFCLLSICMSSFVIFLVTSFASLCFRVTLGLQQQDGDTERVTKANSSLQG